MDTILSDENNKKPFFLFLLILLFLTGCTKRSVNIKEYFKFALKDTFNTHSYIFILSDNEEIPDSLFNEIIKKRNKKETIDSINKRTRYSNTIFSKQEINYTEVNKNGFTITRNGVHGFKNTFKFINDSILLLPDLNYCEGLRPCSLISSCNWKKNEKKGEFIFEGIKSLKIGKKRFNNCAKIKWNFKKGYIYFWLNPSFGIIKSISNTNSIFTIQYRADLILENNDLDYIEEKLTL